MKNENPSASEDVARLLYLLEQGVDEAIAIASRLNIAVCDARREERLSAVVGQPVFSYAAKAIASMSAARGEIVQMHRHLDRVAQQESITVRAFGEEKPKPKERFFTSADASDLAVNA